MTRRRLGDEAGNLRLRRVEGWRREGGLGNGLPAGVGEDHGTGVGGYRPVIADLEHLGGDPSGEDTLRQHKRTRSDSDGLHEGSCQWRLGLGKRRPER
jgi:hypothetical protein